MYEVSLFFVPWDSPQDTIEFSEERETLEEIEIYGNTMQEAANIVRADLDTDSSYSMLRVVKENGAVLGEMEADTIITGSTKDEPVRTNVLHNIQEMLKVMHKAASVIADIGDA